MKRITILAAAGALVAATALGTWATANGADAPAAHVRNVERHDARHGEREPADDHGRHHRHDGRADAVRHEAGPRDDRGGRGEPEPGDDHDGRHHRGHH